MVLRILTSLTLILALGAVLGFASKEASDLRVRAVKVDVRDAESAHFLHPERIKDHLGVENIEGELIRDVDLQLVATHLLDMGSCAKAEVYPTMDGTLHIEVWQRRPVLRVHVTARNNASHGDTGGQGAMPSSSPDFYLDEEGHRMELDAHFTPRVPIMHVEHEGQADIGLRFIQSVGRDPFWTSLVDQLTLNEHGELVVIPRLAGHEIILGDDQDQDHKKRNLLAFYRAHIQRGNLRNYQRIDLTYRDQVIAQRYP
ncbi:MAG: hypothetical protein O3B70_03375 [Bacteroidetes bacterium]|nr:hypothetical protein [Bacteroidota bacterium]MDA0903352.1 hypothetical protein [Bacteroidota bacterium]MDA1242318.1 hypothetical protein [Bacteroidota bacterium]